MRVTPLDIIQKQFSAGRRGYEPEEVRAFLDEIRESMEELLKENQRLRQLVSQREAEIEELRSHEADVKDTLLLARRLTGELERNARREADVIVGEARLEAERILMATSDERREAQARIVTLRATRARLLADLRAIVDAHGAVLSAYEQDTRADDVGAEAGEEQM